MRNATLIAGLVCLGAASVHAQTSYTVQNRVVITNGGCELSKTICILPAPLSNNYQTIEGLNVEGGELLRADDRTAYARQVKTDSLPETGKSAAFAERFSVTLYPMTIDFTQFKRLYPYDTSSDVYKRYTRSDSLFVDTGNETLRREADRLWEEARANALEYARLCYLYVAKHFRYLNANTGLHPLSKLLSDGGGDCGNLSTLFITLLRQKGIPAKHIVTVRPDGSYHVWADFYLERYGWIPVDVTAKNANPKGNYFGYCAGDGIVMSEDIGHTVEKEKGRSVSAVLLQTYLWWYQCSGGKGVTSTQEVRSTLLKRPGKPRITRISPRRAEIEWERFAGADSYLVRLYHKARLVDEFTLKGSKTSLRLNRLKADTDYRVEFCPLRKVDNIVTRMGRYKLDFTTKAQD